MVATTDRNQQQAEFRQQYQSAGITEAIANRAATLKVRQEAGDSLDEVESQILSYAERGLNRQNELQALNQYSQDLQRQGFEEVAPSYRDRIGDLDQNYAEHQQRAAVGSELDWANDRRVGLTAMLSQSGIEPNTDSSIRERSQNLTIQEIPGLTEPERAEQRRLRTDQPQQQSSQASDRAIPDLDPTNEVQPDPLLEQADKLMDTASDAGLTQKEGQKEILQGQRLTISREGSKLTISGEGKLHSGKNGQLEESEGITQQDRDSIENLAQLDASELVKRVEQRQLQLQKQRDRQRQAAREVTRDLSL